MIGWIMLQNVQVLIHENWNGTWYFKRDFEDTIILRSEVERLSWTPRRLGFHYGRGGGLGTDGRQGTDWNDVVTR